MLHEQEDYLDNTASWAWQQLSIGKLATVDCWAEVYVENLSSQAVWFDDLEIQTGALPTALVVQETHYDPWGLELAGIGYNASGNAEHGFKFQGKELVGDFGLGWYDFMWRQYDPVLGRFNSVDPMAHLMRRVSPYAFVFNNPLRFVDPDGMVPDDPALYVQSKGNRDVISEESTRTTKTVRTVQKGSREYNRLVKEKGLGEQAKSGASITVVETKKTSTVTSMEVAYDGDDNPTYGNARETTTTETHTNYQVNGENGGDVGGVAEKSSKTRTRENVEMSAGMDGLVSASVAYRKEHGNSITNSHGNAAAIARQEGIAATFGDIGTLAGFRGLVAKPVVSGVKIPEGGVAVAIFIWGSTFNVSKSIGRGLDNLKGDPRAMPCNRCKKMFPNK